MSEMIHCLSDIQIELSVLYFNWQLVPRVLHQTVVLWPPIF